MTSPSIHGKRQPYSASAALEAVGQGIADIKKQDGLTWADIGAVLGKSEDQAAKYADGTAEMGMVAFGRGKREWNGRFTGYFDRLCIDSRQNAICDRGTVTNLLTAVTALNAALEDDDQVDVREVRQIRSELEDARDAINHHLSKLKVAVA